MDKKAEKVSREITFASTQKLNNSVSFDEFMKIIRENKHTPKHPIPKPSST
jgi:hypothetical protein